MKQSPAERNAKRQDTEMRSIYLSWEQNLVRKFLEADHMVRQMTREFHHWGVPSSKYEPFLHEKFQHIMQLVQERGEKE